MNSRSSPLCAGIALVGLHISGHASFPLEIDALFARPVAALQVLDEAWRPRTAFCALEGAAGEIGVLD